MTTPPASLRESNWQGGSRAQKEPFASSRSRTRSRRTSAPHGKLSLCAALQRARRKHRGHAQSGDNRLLHGCAEIAAVPGDAQCDLSISWKLHRLRFELEIARFTAQSNAPI